MVDYSLLQYWNLSLLWRQGREDARFGMRALSYTEGRAGELARAFLRSAPIATLG